MEDFDIPEEELKRIRKEAEERHRAEQEHRRATAQPNPEQAETAGSRPEESLACPKCGFSFNWDGVRCGHCKYAVPGATSSATPKSLPEQRGFFPRLDPSTPVGEVFRSPFGMLLLICWVPNVLLLAAIVTGVWPGPPKAEYQSAAKSWPSDEDRRAAIAAYERYKAFEGVRDSALSAAICGPLALGLGLYVVMTQKKTTGYDHTTAQIKVGWSLIAIAGAIMVVGAPVFVGYRIWRYCTL